MLRIAKNYMIINNRSFKNFGHKRQPESRFTVLWHGFLTFTFIGFGIEWKRVTKFFFGESTNDTKTGPFDM
ncbi:unnamed protein product, partial [Brenthis ino]